MRMETWSGVTSSECRAIFTSAVAAPLCHRGGHSPLVGHRHCGGGTEEETRRSSSELAEMMLRRAVSDQAMPGDGAGAGRLRGAAFFAVPRLLVGFGPDCDGSPRSALDLRTAFPTLVGGSLLRSPRSPRSWDSQRVGLGGLVDTLAEPARLLGSQMRPTKLQCITESHSCSRVEPDVASAGAAGMSVPCTRFYGDVKSGPEAIVSQLGFNCDSSSDLGKFPAPGSLPASIGGGLRRYIGSVSATEIEQSEDYTCIIAHGPNPKTTHIFGDCILEPCAVRAPDAESEETDEVKEGAVSYWLVKCSGDAGGEEAMRFCSACKKKLDGDGSCIYRDAKAFCGGTDCRDQEILNEEEEENNFIIYSPGSTGSSSVFHDDDIFIHGMVGLT